MLITFPVKVAAGSDLVEDSGRVFVSERAFLETVEQDMTSNDVPTSNARSKWQTVDSFLLQPSDPMVLYPASISCFNQTLASFQSRSTVFVPIPSSEAISGIVNPMKYLHSTTCS